MTLSVEKKTKWTQAYEANATNNKIIMTLKNSIVLDYYCLLNETYSWNNGDLKGWLLYHALSKDHIEGMSWPKDCWTYGSYQNIGASIGKILVAIMKNKHNRVCANLPSLPEDEKQYSKERRITVATPTTNLPMEAYHHKLSDRSFTVERLYNSHSLCQ